MEAVLDVGNPSVKSSSLQFLQTLPDFDVPKTFRR